MESKEITMELSMAQQIKRHMYFMIKRAFDIVCGFIGILSLIPIAIFVKICYMCTGDYYPIFFTQMRIGKNGKLFNFYKFRTMIPNADEELAKMLEKDNKLKKEYEKNRKLKDDPRITKFGKFIRRYSLDEFPQFINVFIGNMSLIGNRPYLPREKKAMGKYYNDIIKTKPGITGLWQVSGRSDISFRKRLKIEQEYSNTNSFRLDIKILFRTIKAVFKGDGAM